MIATLATRAAAEGHGRRRRHRRPRRVPARARPAPQGALQQARRVRLRALRRGRHLERTGVTPAQYADYAALRGDTSDNLPGVPGIGEKTAAKLVNTYGDLEGDLRPPRRAAAEAATEPRRVARPGAPEPGDVDAAPRLSTSTSSPTTCARARATARRSVCSSTSSSSARSAAAAGSGRRAARAERRGPRRSTSGRVAARRARRGRAARRVATAGERYAIEPALGWRRRAQRRSSGSAIADVDGDVPTSTRELLARRRRCAPRSSELVAPAGPPLVAHRAKELMHGLARRRPHLDRDTAVMAYLLDPGEGKYQLEDLALRFLALELTSPDGEEGTLDLDGDARRSRRPAGGPPPCCGSADALADALRGARARPTSTSGSSGRSCACSRGWRTPASASTASSSTSCARSWQECDELERRIHTHAGEPFNVNSMPQLRRSCSRSSSSRR